MSIVTEKDIPLFKEESDKLIREINVILKDKLTTPNAALTMFKAASLATHVMSLVISFYRNTTGHTDRNNLESLLSAIVSDAKEKSAIAHIKATQSQAKH